MPLFRVDSATNKAQRCQPDTFGLERRLQNIVEASLEEIFHVRFIAREFSIRAERSQGINAQRIDTLGLDEDDTPTIIEYKLDKNKDIVLQGLSYLSWLNTHRGDFENAARNKLGREVKINWGHPRLILIAQSFGQYDKGALDLITNFPVELWEYAKYGDDLLHFNLAYGPQRLATTKPIMDLSEQRPGEDFVVEKTYAVEDHLRERPERIRDIFSDLREGILALAIQVGEITETANKGYISYRHGRNFCEVATGPNDVSVLLDIPLRDLDDPQQMGRDVSTKGRWATGQVELKVKAADQLQYVIGLIEQAYRRTL